MRKLETANSDAATLEDRYLQVRRFSEALSAPLSPEDCTIQSMPDVSPTRWHLAHTSWFFETFLLRKRLEYRPFDRSYEYLFNSYYNSVGQQFPRSRRGRLSRPGQEEVLAYREYVDEHVLRLLEGDSLQKGDNSDEPPNVAWIVELGLQHEQQHQELILTDIKHVLSCNPLHPVYREGEIASASPGQSGSALAVEAGVYWIGHDGDTFCFDNESPRHRVFLDAYSIRDQVVTCGDYLRFIEDGGYQCPNHWLSLGWQTVCENEWTAPLYWFQHDDHWQQFTLSGPREIDPHLPVCHVSYFEADAFARWAGMRLPTEAEWEVAARIFPVSGNFSDTLIASGSAIHPTIGASGEEDASQFLGNVWEWTASPYVAYPGYNPPEGALGEYNGKFMCNQFVLRGGSCATSSDHIRATYRNFFPPEARWQFSGLRLCSR